MSEIKVFSGDISATDDFFTRWLKRLHQSLEALNKNVRSSIAPSVGHMHPSTSSLVSKVIAVIDEGQEHLPSWLSSLRKEKSDHFKKIMSMISIGEELKTKLIKLRTPYAMRELNEIHRRYVDILGEKEKHESSSTSSGVVASSSSSSSTSACPVFDHSSHVTRNPVDRVLGFLSNIEETTGDNVLEFCRLADANHRYHSVSKQDTTRIRKLLDMEKGHQSSTASTISMLEKRLSNVKTTSSSSPDSEGSVVQQGISLIEKELASSTEALRVAEIAEEQARLAYEQACLARKRVASKVTGLVDTISTVQTHKKLIADVSSRRLDLAKYSNSVASEGIQLLNEYQAYMEAVHETVGKPRVTKEVPAIFSHLISSFTAYMAAQQNKSSNDIPCTHLDQFNVVMNNRISPHFNAFGAHEADDDLCKVDFALMSLAQIGLEMTRLWRQLNSEETYTDEVWATITKFEQEIQTKFLKNAMQSMTFPLDQNMLRSRIFQRDSQHIPRYQDTTVVLYYDHLQHLTPKWHFENIHRVTASMKLLVEQAAQTVNYDTSWADSSSSSEEDDEDGGASGPSKRHCRRGRELELLSCNDVVAPPLWALPMTHNPTYLQHLYEVAVQAQDRDIYAPLEFESDFDDDDDEEMKELPPDAEDKKFSFSLNSDVSSILGPDLEEHFLSILKINKKDSILANSMSNSKKLSKKSTRESGGSIFTGRVGNNTGILFSGGSGTKQGLTSSRQVSMRVVTPYGMGVIIEPVRVADGMQKVCLDWGATCTFNAASIQMISDSQQMKDSVGNVLPPHIRSLLTAWRASYGKSVGEDSSVDDDAVAARMSDARHKELDERISPFMKFIVNCLANVCGVLRPVADLFKINPSTFSAWLNGRASDSMCESATQSAKTVFMRISYDAVARRLNPGDSEDATGDSESDDDSDNERLENDSIDDNRAPAKASSSPRAPMQQLAKQSSTPTDKSVASKPSTLLSSSSPRSKVVHTSGPRFEYDMYSLTDSGGYKGQIAQRPPKETIHSEQLRTIVRSLMKRNKLTESVIAQEFSTKFEPTKPGTITSWLNYRTTYHMDAKLNFYMFLWIEERRSGLAVQENKDLELLRLFVESISNAKNDIDNLDNDNNGEDDPEDDAGDDDDDVDADNEDDDMDNDSDNDSGGDGNENDNASNSDADADVDVDADNGSDNDSTTGDIKNDKRRSILTSQSGMDQDESEDDMGASSERIESVEHGSDVDGYDNSDSDRDNDNDDVNDDDDMDVEVSRGVSDDEIDISVVSDVDQDLISTSATPRRSAGSSSNKGTPGSESDDVVKMDDSFAESAAPLAKPSSVHLTLSDINTLRFTIIDEIMRRGITQTTAAEEANLCIIGLSQGAISKLLHKGSFGGGTKALKFRNLMEDWVGNSKLQPDAEGYCKVSHVLSAIKKECSGEVVGNAISLGGGAASKTHDDEMEVDNSFDGNANVSVDDEEGEDEEDSDDKNKEVKELNEELRDILLEEIKRRGCSQAHVIDESGLIKHGFSQPTISRFISNMYLMSGNRGLLFKQVIKKWIKKSRLKHGAVVLDVKQSKSPIEESADVTANEDSSAQNVDTDDDSHIAADGFKEHAEDDSADIDDDKHSDTLSSSTSSLFGHVALIPVLELRSLIMAELNRRGLSQRGSAIEAKFDKNGLPYCTVNRLINCRKCNNDESGVKFRELMQAWLKTSASQPTVNFTPLVENEIDKDNDNDENNSGQEEDNEKEKEEGQEDEEVNDSYDKVSDSSEQFIFTPGDEDLFVLQNDVRAELSRRHLYQAAVAKEAQLAKIGCDPSHLSRFLLRCYMPGYGRAGRFYEHMTAWVEQSKKLEAGKFDAKGLIPVPKHSTGGMISVEGLLSTEDLQFEVNAEAYRRSVSISSVFSEANIAISTVSNSALARYLQKGNCPVGERGIVFRNCLEDWLKESKTKPDVKVKSVKDRTLQAIPEHVPVTTTKTSTAVTQAAGLVEDFYQRQSQRRKASSISSQNSEDGDGDDDDDDMPMKKARRQLGGGGYEGKGEVHVPLIRAERFKENFHHPWCKECNISNKAEKSGEEMLECGSCPYSFHVGCENSSSAAYRPHIPSNFSNSQQGRQWFCTQCRQSGAPIAHRLKTSEINSNSGIVDQPWVLFYASHLRRWRQGFVCDADVTRKLLLCKWWRTDNKWGKSNWVDISCGAPMLWLSNASSFLDVGDELAKRSRATAVQDLRKSHPQYFGPFSAVQAVVKKSEMMSSLTSLQEPARPQVSSRQGLLANGDSVRNTAAAGAAATSRSVFRDGSGSSKNRDRPQKLPKEEEKEEPMQSNIDTFLSADSLKAACCAAGTACRAVDVVMCGSNTNAFVCSRPPGHHAGRKGFTEKCRGTGFCLLNNAAIAMLYARVRWGVQRVAVVDIDVHFGNGTSELLKGDPRAFFGCVHMIYGEENEGFGKEMAERRKRMAACCGPNALRNTNEVSGTRASSSAGSGTKEKNALDRIESFKEGFFPHSLGCTDIQDNYMSVGVYPDIHNSLRTVDTDCDQGTSGEDESAKKKNKPFPQASLCGPAGFRRALRDFIIPQMEKFDPELLIISAGFDGLATDPLGGDLGLTTSDFSWATHALLQSMNRAGGSGHGRVVSLLEGGYDIKRETQGLATAVNAHVKAMRKHPVPAAGSN